MVTRVLPLMLLVMAALPGCTRGSEAAAAETAGKGPFELVRLAIPSLGAAVADHVIQRAEGFPGKLRAILETIARAKGFPRCARATPPDAVRGAHARAMSRAGASATFDIATNATGLKPGGTATANITAFYARPTRAQLHVKATS